MGTRKKKSSPGRKAWGNPPRWLRILARIGYAAKAAIYLLIGGLALGESIGGKRTSSDPEQAMRLLQLQPLGGILLGLLAAGLLCYGVHRGLESLWGPVRSDSTFVRILHRAGRAGGAACYLGLAALAIDLLVVRHHSRHPKTALAERLLHLPFGSSILFLAGAILAGIGGKFLYDAVSGRYRRSFDLGHQRAAVVTTIRLTAVFGICTRAMLFLCLGGLTIYAAVRSAPGKAGGMNAVGEIIEQLPFGRWVFGLLAAGFFAYGLFCIIRGRYGIYPSDAGV